MSTLLVAGAGIYIFSKVFPNFQPGSKKVEADIQAMREDMVDKIEALIPLKEEEYELLSSHQEDKARKRGFTKGYEGVFTTIFHEPAIAYQFKKYISTGTNHLLYARTAAHEYIFWTKSKGTKLVIDGKYVGDIRDKGILYGGSKNREMAKIDRKQEDFLPIVVLDKEVASLVKAKLEPDDDLSPRAFEYVRSGLTAEEKALMMALVIYEMVLMRTIKLD